MNEGGENTTQILSSCQKVIPRRYIIIETANRIINKLDPVSRVTGIPGWYWIREIKCSDTTRVGLVY